LRFFFNQERAMTKIRREEVYLSPMKAEQFTGLSRKALIAYVKTGVLNQYRTEGGHRRYALSELKALRQALGRHATK
jgi:predicted site-specific integrase-resolvase